MQLSVGEVVEGKVKGIAVFGAFIELPDGQTGLVHISEVAAEYVKDIKDHLKENDLVKVKIMSFDPKGKIALSIKRALPEPEGADAASMAAVGAAAGPPAGRTSRQAGGRTYAGRRTGPQRGTWNPDDGAPRNMSFEDALSKFIKDSEEKQHDLRRNFESKRGGGYRK